MPACLHAATPDEFSVPPHIGIRFILDNPVDRRIRPGCVVVPPADAVTQPIFTQAVEMASAALVMFEQLGQSHGQIIAAQNLAEAYLYLDDLTAAESYDQRVIDSRSPGVLPDGLRTLSELRLDQHDFAGAEAAIRQSLQLAQAKNDHYLEGYGLHALVRLHLTLQQSAAMRAAFERAVDLFESLDMLQEVERTQLTWRRCQDARRSATPS